MIGMVLWVFATVCACSSRDKETDARISLRVGPQKDHVIDPAALESAMLDGDGRYRRRDKKKGGGSSSAGNKRKDGTDSDFMPSDNEAGAGTGDGDDGSGSDFEDEPAAPKKRGRGRPPAVRPKPRAVIQERANKAARAHAKSYAPTSIVAPQYVITRVLAELSRAQVRKKSTVVQKIARYWSLKRASRRGAPLLKRLHLEVGFSTTGERLLHDCLADRSTTHSPGLLRPATKKTKRPACKSSKSSSTSAGTSKKCGCWSNTCTSAKKPSSVR